MLIEILKRTPYWVFILFVALLTLGLFQSKGRMVSRSMVVMFPVAMIVLSFYGAASAFGLTPAAVACWGLGIAVAMMAGRGLLTPQGVTFAIETQTFFIPGSWLPLVLMMGIFFTKYAAGIILARQLPIAGSLVFEASISFCYGLFSGLFLARAWGVWHAAQRDRPPLSN